MARDDVLHAPLNDLLHPLGHPRHDEVDQTLLVGDLEAPTPFVCAPSLIPTAMLVRTLAVRVMVVPVAVMVVLDLVTVVLLVMPGVRFDLAMLMRVSVVVRVVLVGGVGELLLRVRPPSLVG